MKDEHLIFDNLLPTNAGLEQITLGTTLSIDLEFIRGGLDVVHTFSATSGERVVNGHPIGNGSQGVAITFALVQFCTFPNLCVTWIFVKNELSNSNHNVLNVTVVGGADPIEGSGV